MPSIRSKGLPGAAFIAVLLVAGGASAADTPKDLNTPRQFPPVATRQEWEIRAKQIREQILVSCGLWPLPEKTPLNAHVFGKVERDGYSVEKVHLQPFPGVYLGGNLYRPLGRGKGPFPAVLNPHGHWREGRLADSKDGSIAARCISFARQGMVAFSYDMQGYNDTFFPDHGDVPADKLYLRHRQFATNRVCLLWAISQMGLQTWNSVRALDFLESLPDVDPKRLACTGESGGGTQTFMLGAIDDRLIAQAPVVMVSHTMQGGCSCENVSGLRVEYSNMEIAAAAAPRPQILVAATGDWTRATLTVEGPAIQQVYSFFNAPERLRFVRFDYNHNYNQTSREAVYDWFAKWVRKSAPADAASCKEAPYHKEPDADLRVFPDGKLPAGALTEKEFTERLIRQHQQAWADLVPRNKRSVSKMQEALTPAWRHTLLLDWPQSTSESVWRAGKTGDSFRSATLQISRSDSNKVSALYFTPPTVESPPAGGKARNPTRIVVFAEPGPASSVCDESGEPTGLARNLIERNCGVLVIREYSTDAPKDQFANFFTTYNRTLLQERVRDLMAVCGQARAIRGKSSASHVVLCGFGRAGLWSLLAAPSADAVIADADQLNSADDASLLSPELFCPGLRNIGGFEGGAMLAAPHSLLIHNTGDRFSTESLEATYKALGESKKLRRDRVGISQVGLVEWIAALK